MSALFKNLFLLSLIALAGCTRITGGNGEVFGGGDITKQLLNRIRNTILLDSVRNLADGRQVSCNLEALCSEHSETRVCQSRPVLNQTEVQACEYIIQRNIGKLLSVVQSTQVTMESSEKPIFDNGARVSAITSLSSSGPIRVDVARVREQNLTDSEIATLFAHEFLHKVQDLMPGTGYLDDEDSLSPFSQGRKLLDAIATVVGIGTLRRISAKTARIAVGTDSGILRTLLVSEQKLASDLFQQLDAFGEDAAPAIASGDLNGDGTADLVLSSALSSQVIAIDGKTGSQLASWVGLGAGSSVAVGDVNGDGLPDVLVGTPPGPVNKIVVYDNLNQSELYVHQPYDTGFISGVYVAAGDVNGDGRDEIVSTPRLGGGPHLKVYDPMAGIYRYDGFVYNPAYVGGVSVAAGDLNGNGRDEIIVGAAFGAGPHVRALDVVSGTIAYDGFPYDPGFTGGVLVASGDTDGDGLAEIITVPHQIENLPLKVLNPRNSSIAFQFQLSQGATGPRTLAFIR
ncbi:MAG: VCBS repeat-containing protein [Bdellovibrionaceae bacterium]|nr:VCBS repeat-containing protein [Bdellovibrionales bacterium]MCB9253216.1 VCBS repeat-containing protein [Pseudobdellovibrionaceae bacterium]